MPKLTKRLIDATPYPASGQVFHRDDELRGFALRVTPRSKAFIVEKKIYGRARRFTLGPYGPVTLDQARKLAQKKIGEIAKGEDPASERKNRRQASTWHDLEKLYLERHAAHKKSGRNDAGILTNHLTQWRTRRLLTITRAEVCARHADIGAAGHKTAANRVVALIRTMFSLAKDWGLFDGDNPATRIKFFKEVSRDRFVTPDELPRLWAALQAEPNPYVRAAFLISLLTGARRTEVLTMGWKDLDLRQGIWTIGDTKSGRQHVLPLPRPAVDVLLTLPRIADNPFVFCGRWGRSHLVNVAKPWKRIRTRAKLEDVRIHDLRRTLGSWMVAAGASLSLIGKTLNHSSVSTTAVYARLQLDPVRQALEANAERMLTYAERTESN